MSFTNKEREIFLSFLSRIEYNIHSFLGADCAIQFYRILTDFSIDDAVFEYRIAEIFFDSPEKLKEFHGTLKDLGILRGELMGNGSNAAEARKITSDFFLQQMQIYKDNNELNDESIEFFTSEEHEDNGGSDRNETDDTGKSDEHIQMEEQLAALQAERDILQKNEVEERKERLKRKKDEEKKIQERRQIEHEEFIEERKERKDALEREIEMLQVQLQAQFEVEIAESNQKKEKEMEEMYRRQEMAYMEQERQSEIRAKAKEKELKQMEARQNKLLEIQFQQQKDRLQRKGG